MHKIINTAIVSFFTGTLIASLIFITMRIHLTENEIGLQKAEDNTYYFRINQDVKVENFKTKEEALNHAEKLAAMYLRQKFKK